MIKVVFLVTCMSVGGAEKVLVNLVNGMDKSKYDITVMSIYKYSIYGDDNQTITNQFTGDIEIKYACNNTNKIKFRLFEIVLNKVNVKILHKIFIGKKYDVEIAFTEGLPTKFLSQSTNEKSKKIAWFHTDALNRIKNLSEDIIQKERQIYKKYDYIVGVSNKVTESFEKVFGKYTGLCTKYNPININQITIQANEYIPRKSKEVLQLVTVGRLIEVKGYNRLIEVLRRLKRKGYDFMLIIVGEGDQKEALKRQVKEYNLESNIEFVGFQSNPYKYIAKSDTYICSSLAEGYSTAVLESIVLGTPVVTTECSGMKEIFGEKKCGIICPNNNEGLYSAIESILKEPQSIKSYKEECRERAKELGYRQAIEYIQEII